MLIRSLGGTLGRGFGAGFCSAAIPDAARQTPAPVIAVLRRNSRRLVRWFIDQVLSRAKMSQESTHVR